MRPAGGVALLNLSFRRPEPPARTTDRQEPRGQIVGTDWQVRTWCPAAVRAVPLRAVSQEHFSGLLVDDPPFERSAELEA